MAELYDMGSTSDLTELWDNPSLFESGLGSDSLTAMVCAVKDDYWSGVDLPNGMRSSSGDKQNSSSVILRDRLMTDAALGGGPKPIKTEHSYSLLPSSPPHSSRVHQIRSCSPVITKLNSHSTTIQQQVILCPDGTYVTRISSPRIDVTDMEEECFPAISMDKASGRDSSGPSPEPVFSSNAGCTDKRLRRDEDDGDDSKHKKFHQQPTECAIVKGEPVSAPGSPCTTDASVFLDDKSTVAISPHSLHIRERFADQTSDDSEDDDDDMQAQEFKVETMDIPCEDEMNEQATSQELPPTPPSSASSDSEGTVSASCSPERRDSHGSVHVHQSLRGFLQPRLYVTTSGTIGQHTSTRQPIHTPLISCQPKGSTGVLILTEEEKRTLLAEGYPVPTKLPLTKQEEKSLKKVRRKIKNKISAQESRRKKKEYMDGLERRVTLLTSENSSYREKLTNMENINRQLQKELQRLQAIINRMSS